MSTRTIIECDRCRREIGTGRASSVTFGGSAAPLAAKKDLCETCRSKLEDFLNGRELDEPP